MSDIECPYCGEDQEINHDDGYGYGEGETYQQQCSNINCGKTFAYTTSVSFYHEASKADCLNDGEHDWKLTHTIPKKYSKMYCSMCDEKRQPTVDERKEFKLDED